MVTPCLTAPYSSTVTSGNHKKRPMKNSGMIATIQERVRGQAPRILRLIVKACEDCLQLHSTEIRSFHPLRINKNSFSKRQDSHEVITGSNCRSQGEVVNCQRSQPD